MIESTSKSERISRPLILNREIINIESHQLVLLSNNISNIPSIEDLRRNIDYTKLFSTVEKCLQYINQTKNTVTFMICSRQFLPDLTSKFQNYKSISKIYVFDFSNDSTNSEKILPSSDSRIKETVYTEQSVLINDLSHDVQQYLHFEKQSDKLAELQQTSTTYFSSSWITLVDLWCHLQYPMRCLIRLIL
ncbi:unnamed protein product [Adineta ricciae]|uniref:Uncharacterized protein n=1 Tax=Adineta ricciae TaxID=249248 RepID=A0A814Y4J3_ADIRI|nr:unnamed protein product [Adineta ricciae]CAF1437572.1 unnamed protein product [Adineta ricciae]